LVLLPILLTRRQYKKPYFQLQAQLDRVKYITNITNILVDQVPGRQHVDNLSHGTSSGIDHHHGGTKEIHGW